MVWGAFGLDYQDAACPAHAAEEAQRWAHPGEVEVVLRVPRAACLDVNARLAGRLIPAARIEVTADRG
ncbi:hypothetical protein ACFU5Y_11590 [Streptomyces gardneri]|uniref:hypothetical protein n=1 Tax=Streptomyces gardneri TaxID=66892 RepID=UPI0036CE06EF